jgi:hypothetical protein
MKVVTRYVTHARQTGQHDEGGCRGSILVSGEVYRKSGLRTCMPCSSTQWMGGACKRCREKTRGDHCKGRCWTHCIVIKATWGEMKGWCYLWPASSVIEPKLLTVIDSYWQLWQLVTYIDVYHFFIQKLSLASIVSFPDELPPHSHQSPGKVPVTFGLFRLFILFTLF